MDKSFVLGLVHHDTDNYALRLMSIASSGLALSTPYKAVEDVWIDGANCYQP